MTQEEIPLQPVHLNAIVGWKMSDGRPTGDTVPATEPLIVQPGGGGDEEKRGARFLKLWNLIKNPLKIGGYAGVVVIIMVGTLIPTLYQMQQYMSNHWLPLTVFENCSNLLRIKE